MSLYQRKYALLWHAPASRWTAEKLHKMAGVIISNFHVLFLSLTPALAPVWASEFVQSFLTARELLLHKAKVADDCCSQHQGRKDSSSESLGVLRAIMVLSISKSVRNDSLCNVAFVAGPCPAARRPTLFRQRPGNTIRNPLLRAMFIMLSSWMLNFVLCSKSTRIVAFSLLSSYSSILNAPHPIFPSFPV